MLLRRIMKHVTDQNWFAVLLDFVIVVSGVWLALFVGQTADDRNRQAEFEVIFDGLKGELAYNYFTAHERLLVSPCRVQKSKELSEALLNVDEPWPGKPGVFGDDQLGTYNYRAFPDAIRVPFGHWTDVYFQSIKGNSALNLIPAAYGAPLISWYNQIGKVTDTEEHVYRIAGRLNTLAYPAELSISDLEGTGFLTSGDLQSINGLTADQLRAYKNSRIELYQQIYGECAASIDMALVD